MSKANKLVAEFMAQLQILTGKPCWGLYAGPPTGSHLSLHFDGKRPRKKPLLHSRFTEDEQQYEGEIVLFIASAWRLDSERSVICGSTDPNDLDGPMVQGVRSLVNQSVEAVETAPPAFDLVVKFTGALQLKVFCDQMDPGEYEWDNYVLSLLERRYVVGAKGALRRVPRGGL